MRSMLLLSIILSIYLISCENESNIEEPGVILDANFTTTDTLYSILEHIEIQNIGDTVASYYWDFGDGSSSVERNPSHLYSEAGIYNIKLKIIDNLGNSDSITKQIKIGEWFAYQIELLHLDEYKYYKKDEYWDEDSTGINALPDIYFEIKDTTGQVYYTSETYYNLPSTKIPLTFKVPDIKIEHWLTRFSDAVIWINLNEIDGDTIENIMTSFDIGGKKNKHDRANRKGEITFTAGASFKVLYKVK